jgi:hypothetical protein
LMPNMFPLGTLETLKLVPNMFTPTFPYLCIASVPANVHPSITSTPVYTMMWQTHGIQVAAYVDDVTHNYRFQLVNILLIDIGWI